MAIEARAVPLTRETFAQWFDAYTGDPDMDELRDYFQVKLESTKLDGVMVDTTYRDDMPNDESALIDLIMSDLPSYDAYHRIFV